MFVMSPEQWMFVSETLDQVRSNQKEIEEERGPTKCGTCSSCCQIQTPTVSLLDAFWAVKGVKKLGLWESTLKKLKHYLSRPITGQGIAIPCPLLGPRGCTIHGYHPMVCRSFNFTKSGGSACGLMWRPGIDTKKSRRAVEYYFDARIQFEKLFLNGATNSITNLPAAMYTIMVDAKDIEAQIQLGELYGPNFETFYRNDSKEFGKFITLKDEKLQF